jgi:hypothetical protein
MANLIWMEFAFFKTIHYCHACDSVTSQKVWMCDIVIGCHLLSNVCYTPSCA